MNQDNLRLLHAVAALEEYTAEPADDDAIAHALARLDLKVALLLELVGKLLMERSDMPASVPVRLGSHRLTWPDATGSLRPGDAGIAAVWLRASPATPLQIAGEVAAVRPQDAGCEVELSYLGLDEPVGEALEKLIFRHHRRAIANRHPGPQRQ